MATVSLFTSLMTEIVATAGENCVVRVEMIKAATMTDDFRNWNDIVELEEDQENDDDDDIFSK